MTGIDVRVRTFIDRHRIARLATADGQGHPSVIPICYAFQNDVFYSVIDEKPKKLPAVRLRRIQNIRCNPNVALVIDDYSEDWHSLAYVHVRGRAEIIESDAGEEHAGAVEALRDRYVQYRSMKIDAQPIIKLVPESVYFWQAEAPPAPSP